MMKLREAEKRILLVVRLPGKTDGPVKLTLAYLGPSVGAPWRYLPPR